MLRRQQQNDVSKERGKIMENNTCLEKQPLCEEMLEKMNAYWRAAN